MMSRLSEVCCYAILLPILDDRSYQSNGDIEFNGDHSIYDSRIMMVIYHYEILERASLPFPLWSDLHMSTTNSLFN